MIQVKCTISDDVKLPRLKSGTTTQPNCRYFFSIILSFVGVSSRHFSAPGLELLFESMVSLIDAQVKFYFRRTWLSPKTMENSGKDLFHGVANWCDVIYRVPFNPKVARRQSMKRLGAAKIEWRLQQLRGTFGKLIFPFCTKEMEYLEEIEYQKEVEGAKINTVRRKASDAFFTNKYYPKQVPSYTFVSSYFWQKHAQCTSCFQTGLLGGIGGDARQVQMWEVWWLFLSLKLAQPLHTRANYQLKKYPPPHPPKIICAQKNPDTIFISKHLSYSEICKEFI